MERTASARPWRLGQRLYGRDAVSSGTGSVYISLRTTNSRERVNREIRRREQVVSIFPNTDSAERLIGAVLMDIHEDWEKNRWTFLMKTGNPIVGRT